MTLLDVANPISYAGVIRVRFKGSSHHASDISASKERLPYGYVLKARLRQALRQPARLHVQVVKVARNGSIGINAERVRGSSLDFSVASMLSHAAFSPEQIFEGFWF